MAQTDTSRRAIGSSFSGKTAFASSFRTRKKGKSKRKNLPTNSRAAYLPPDLDIVSGFAFLSFSNIEELECHIEDHEVNTRSLSINVGEKRKKKPSIKEKFANPTVVEAGTNISKRIKIPSQKILESYATSDISLTKSRPTASNEPKRIKVKPFPVTKNVSTSSSNFDSNFSPISNNERDSKEKVQCFKFSKFDLSGKETSTAEISLECSERIDISLFEDGDACRQLTHQTNVSECESIGHSAATAEEGMLKKKKKKKRKRDKGINDQTCQTMFRIKKKKKDVEKHDENSTASFKNVPDIAQETSGASTPLTQEASQSNIATVETTECEMSTKCLVPAQTETNTDEIETDIFKVDDEISGPDKCQLKVQTLKSQDLKSHRLKISNKVEKIDYCARSGGVSLVERHHERQNKLKQDEPAEFVSCGQQFPSEIENDSQDCCDASVGADYLSEMSGTDSSNNSSYGEQDAPVNIKSRIFSGSSSVFVSSIDETNDVTDVDIESEESDASKPLINIVRALPKSYLFGHLSTYPDKTVKGTIDVSIQVYENDISIYMNYAADFKGKIIKIIVPDNEDSKCCFPRSTSLSGLPKFLQPREYVKAVRCATERNRRHTIGDLFQSLKNELFGDVRDFYFSKQAILTKAIETLEQSEVESHALESMKDAISLKNQTLRKELNILLFGEDLPDGKMLDLNKVTEYLKSLCIEIELPEDQIEGSSASKEKDSYKTDDNSSNDNDKSKLVTRKGRPPLEGKFLKTFSALKADAPLKQPKLPNPTELSRFVRDAFHDKMKEFVSIAPSDSNKVLSEDLSKSKVNVDSGDEEKVNILHKSSAVTQERTNDSTINKIVCNLTKYRIHQQSGSVGAMKIMTNPEPLKGIDSKNVVHIKILNDTMKQVGFSQDLSTIRNKKCASPKTSNTGNGKDAKVSDGVQHSASFTIKSTPGTSKMINNLSQPLNPSEKSSNAADITTKPALSKCKSEMFSTGQHETTTSTSLATSKNFGLVSEKKETNQGSTQTIESDNSQTKSTTEATLTAAGASCPSIENTTSGDKVTAYTLPNKSDNEVVIATKQTTVTEGSKIVDVKASTNTQTYMMAKPQSSSNISVSQTQHQHQPVPSIHLTTFKPLQGKPSTTCTLEKGQQNQIVACHVPMTTSSISTKDTPVVPIKQVVTTKVNTPYSFTVLPMATTITKATKVMPVVKMTQLKTTNFPTQQSIALLPGTKKVSTVTPGTHMVQMTPAIASKMVTPHSITVLPVTRNITMAKPGTQMLQVTQSTGSKVTTPQSIAGLPMATNVTIATRGTPVFKMTQAISPKAASPYGIALGSPSTVHTSSSHYVTLVETPNPNTQHASSKKTFIVPNSALPGSAAPYRIFFKPSGQARVINTPFPQIKSAIQSTNVIGVPLMKGGTTPLQKMNSVCVTTSVTAPISQTSNNKVFFQDKIPVTNKQVNVQNIVTANNIPVQYRHLIMKAPPMHSVSEPQLQQSKTLVRVQPTSQTATVAPILPSISPTPEKPIKIQQASTTINDLLVCHPSESTNIVSDPSTTGGFPLNPAACTIKQLLVTSPLNSPVTLHVKSAINSSNNSSLNNKGSGQDARNNPIPTEGRSPNLFNMLLTQSGSAQNSGSKFVSLGQQGTERGLLEAIPQLTQKPGSDLVSVDSKETFSEIEKMLAKIPSPNVTNSLTTVDGNQMAFASNFSASSILKTSVVYSSCPKTLEYSTRTTQTLAETMKGSTLCSDGQAFNTTTRPQTLIDAKCLSQSQMMAANVTSPPFTSISSRDRIPSNQPKCNNSQATEATRPTSASYSSTCISTSASFDEPKPTKDKTCSVVDSPELISHVVTADTLSICNIDSSIPDITSELTSHINPVAREYSSQSHSMEEWKEQKESSLPSKESNPEKKSRPDFELQDESTAEDFDLLSTFEWNNTVSNNSNAVSPAGHT